MEQYISKSSLIGEIKKLKERFINQDDEFSDGYHFALKLVLSFIDTLEVKEVDLNKEIKDYFDNQPIITRSKGVDYQLIPSGENIAKYFFELGLKVAQKGE